jgi:hypothetical protein
MSASSPATVNVALENITCSDGESIPQVLGDAYVDIYSWDIAAAQNF